MDDANHRDSRLWRLVYDPGNKHTAFLKEAVIRKTNDLTAKEALDLETQKAVDLIVSGESIHGLCAFLSRQKPSFPEIEDEITGRLPFCRTQTK